MMPKLPYITGGGPSSRKGFDFFFFYGGNVCPRRFPKKINSDNGSARSKVSGSTGPSLPPSPGFFEA